MPDLTGHLIFVRAPLRHATVVDTYLIISDLIEIGCVKMRNRF